MRERKVENSAAAHSTIDRYGIMLVQCQSNGAVGALSGGVVAEEETVDSSEDEGDTCLLAVYGGATQRGSVESPHPSGR